MALSGFALPPMSFVLVDDAAPLVPIGTLPRQAATRPLLGTVPLLPSRRPLFLVSVLAPDLARTWLAASPGQTPQAFVFGSGGEYVLAGLNDVGFVRDLNAYPETLIMFRNNLSEAGSWALWEGIGEVGRLAHSERGAGTPVVVLNDEGVVQAGTRTLAGVVAPIPAVIIVVGA